MKNFTFLSLLFVLLSGQSVWAQDNTSVKLSKEIEKIIKSDDKGIIRGYALGFDRSVIKNTEDAKLEGEGQDYLIYKVEFDKNEFAEITYTFDSNKKLNSIGVTFIENATAKEEEQILDDFQRYFNARYGQYTVNDKSDEVWKSADGYVIEMGDATDETASSIVAVEIEFYKP